MGGPRNLQNSHSGKLPSMSSSLLPLREYSSFTINLLGKGTGHLFGAKRLNCQGSVSHSWQSVRQAGMSRAYIHWWWVMCLRPCSAALFPGRRACRCRGASCMRSLGAMPVSSLSRRPRNTRRAKRTGGPSAPRPLQNRISSNRMVSQELEPRPHGIRRLSPQWCPVPLLAGRHLDAAIMPVQSALPYQHADVPSLTHHPSTSVISVSPW